MPFHGDCHAQFQYDLLMLGYTSEDEIWDIHV